MREIKFRIWNPLVKQMQDARENTPVMLGMDISGIYIPDTTLPVMQYTGLKDCKGKEIYEGDIVEVRIDGMGTGHKHPVVWDNDDATYKFGHAMLGGSDVEVIGNIYENAFEPTVPMSITYEKHHAIKSKWGKE